MNILPKNRHILIEPIEDKGEEQQSSVLLPADYHKAEEYVVARVLKVHDSVKSEISEGSLVVAEPNMVREVSIDGSTHYLLQANYILCEVRL
jgi:co-chaperonin GroES (HSP10)